MCCFYCTLLNEIFLILTTCYLKSYNRDICVSSMIQYNTMVFFIQQFYFVTCVRKGESVLMVNNIKNEISSNISSQVPIRAQKSGFNICLSVYKYFCCCVEQNFILNNFKHNSSSNLCLYLNNTF